MISKYDSLIKYSANFLLAAVLTGAAWVANTVYYIATRVPVIESKLQENHDTLVDANGRLVRVEQKVANLPTEFPPDPWQERMKILESIAIDAQHRLTVIETREIVEHSHSKERK